MTAMTVRKQPTANLPTDGLTKQFLVECIAGLEQRIDGKLEAMEQRFDGKLEAMEKRGDVKLHGLHQKIDDVKKHLEARINWYRQDTKEHTESLVKGVEYQLGKRMDHIDHRIDLVEQQVEHVGYRMERLEGKVDAIGTAVIETGRKVQAHDDDIVKLKAAVEAFSQ